jgi:hypothetical protein
MKFNARAMSVSSNAKQTFKLLPRFLENIISKSAHLSMRRMLSFSLVVGTGDT